MNIQEFFILLSPFVRNLIGWFYTASEDGVLEKYEWVKLGQSTLKILAVTFVGFEALNGFGIDIDVFSTMAGAVLIEFLYDYIKRLKS